MAKLRPLLAEFIGTFALIFVGIGAIKTAGHDVLAVALAHGLTIAAFVSATMHISGGHLNPAVTFGVVCGGHMTWPAAIRYWIAQLMGGTAAALICLSDFYGAGTCACVCRATLADRQGFDRQRGEKFTRVLDLEDRCRKMRGEETCIRCRSNAGLRDDFKVR